MIQMTFFIFRTCNSRCKVNKEKKFRDSQVFKDIILKTLYVILVSFIAVNLIYFFRLSTKLGEEMREKNAPPPPPREGGQAINFG
jgi:hypothetical protein